MPIGTPLIIEAEGKARIAKVVEYAEAHRISSAACAALAVTKATNIPDDRNRRVVIPMGFRCCYSIEQCMRVRENDTWPWVRHLSLSMERPGRLPNEIGAWMIAQEFGYWGETWQSASHIYLEDIRNDDGTPGKALNLLQFYDKP